MRKATIKCEDRCVHFATLDQKNFQSSLQRIEAKRLNHLIEFLQNIPCFKSQSRKAISRFTFLLKRKKFTRGQTVYAEGMPAEKIFIVFKGEFELAKKLPRGDTVFEGATLQHTAMVNQRKQKRNILAKRLPEIKDLPYSLKLSIFGRGSLLGEEDVFSRSHFSCTLKCYS